MQAGKTTRYPNQWVRQYPETLPPDRIKKDADFSISVLLCCK